MRAVLKAVRAARGCLDFSMGADLADAARGNVFERWASREALPAFRGKGPGDGQIDVIRRFAIDEFDTDESR